MTSEAYKSFIASLSDGANISNLKFDDLARFKIPCPSLTEQHRVVALLDEVLASLATAKAGTEKNLRNSQAILESCLKNVFSQQGSGWAHKRLREVCRFQNGFAFKSRTFKPTGCPILRISNIQDGQVDATNRLFSSIQPITRKILTGIEW